MIISIGISLIIIALTILIHAFGSVFWIRYQSRHLSPSVKDWKMSRVLRILTVFALFLTLLHFAEISIWSALYMILPDLHSINTFEEAIYYSLITYTTVGYGDITLAPEWRILGGFEAMNGILLIGWSTAMFYSVVQMVAKKYHDHKKLLV